MALTGDIENIPIAVANLQMHLDDCDADIQVTYDDTGSAQVINFFDGDADDPLATIVIRYGKGEAKC